MLLKLTHLDRGGAGRARRAALKSPSRPPQALDLAAKRRNLRIRRNPLAQLQRFLELAVDHRLEVRASHAGKIAAHQTGPS
ncbi:MAG: hypothetical protein WDO24_05460 [Pseudomonadota bacterium]